VPPVIEESQPQAVVTLKPGESGYASVSLSATDGSGSNGYTAKSLTVYFQGRSGNESVGAGAHPSLPAKGVYVDDSLKDIKGRAPQAKIIVLGYPQALSSTGTCPVIDLSAAKRTYMNGFADALAEGTKAAAAQQSVTFVDMRDTCKGHGACGSDPWINDLNNASEVLHPNLTGYLVGYSDELNKAWG